MKILIVSTKQRLSDYVEFVDALNFEGAEAICVNNLKYCFLGETKPLYVVPVPRLLAIIKRFGPDFVLTDSPYYVPQMAKMLDRPAFYHMRGAEEGKLTERKWDIALYPSIFARMYTLYLAKIIVPSMKKTDLILPNSMWLQKQVEQLLPNHPTCVLYVGIAPEKWLPNNNERIEVKHPAVVGVFQFTIYAKFSGFLRFMNVVKRMPDVNFYFAGEGPYFNLAKKVCPPNVTVLGKIPKPKIKKLLEAGDVVVHPSGLDALPRSVKEASLMEKAIIASNVGGIPEIIKNNQTGFLCDIDNFSQWIEKIRFLLENPDVARRFGKNARKFVAETFSWRTIARGFLKNIENFVSK